MQDYKQIVAKEISKITNLPVEELVTYIEIPPNSKMGDYAFPCFRLAKSLKKAPQVIAGELKEQVKLGNNLEKVEVIGGYLNFFINKQVYIKDILTQIDEKKEQYGSSSIGEGKNIIIEYSSPNIAKPMHIGHLRNTVIGGSLCKLYKFLGYNVFALNYLGDWGINFAKIMAGYTMWKDEYDFSNGDLDPIFKIYIRYNELEKENEEYTQIARQWHLRLENGDQEAKKLWSWIREISINEANKIYKRLNCEFDSYNGEAFYNDKMDDIVQELKAKNMLVESEGAQIVDLSKYNMPPCIILTSNGTTLYATRDLASIKYRAKTYNFNKAIYVVGSEQQLYFKQLFKVFELMGYEKYAKNCEHVYYGMILDSQGKKMASRKGTSLTLIDLLNEAVEKSKVIIKEKGINICEIEKLSQQIGIGAVIFNSLYTNKIKDIIFDWDDVLNFQGETGPYIQYIYVRTRGILNKANYVPSLNNVNLSKLCEDVTIEVVKLLGQFSQIILSASEKNEPSILSRYLMDLSQSFSSFYNEHHIICKDKEVQDARLLLTSCVGTVIKTGLGLLGIECPERM